MYYIERKMCFIKKILTASDKGPKNKPMHRTELASTSVYWVWAWVKAGFAFFVERLLSFVLYESLMSSQPLLKHKNRSLTLL